MGKLLTLSKNTFTATVRQPIYGIIVGAALLLIFISPSMTMFSLGQEDKLLRELGLSTLFLMSLFIAIFSACGSVGSEIDEQTISTVLTKPVSRPIFILSKFFGVSGAVFLAHYVCTVGILMAIRHGVLETAMDTHDMTVIAAAVGGAGAALLLSLFFNYVYDWKFSSSVVVLLGIFGTVGIIFLAFINRNWQFRPADNGFNIVDIYGSILLFLGALIIVAVAVAVSTRFNIAVTFSLCVGIFLLGLVSDYAFGRFTEQLWAQVFYYVVPNLQIFWISDAIYEGSAVPVRYIFITSLYAVCYTGAILSVAMAVFQGRQVG